MRKLLITALLLPLAAHAADWSVLLMGASHHFGTKEHPASQYEAWNPGLGFEVARDGWLVRAAAYRDSYDQTATTAVGGYRWGAGTDQGVHADLTVNVGYLNGSGHNGAIAFPSIGVGHGRTTLEFTYKPASSDKPVAAVAAMLRIKL